MKITKKQVRELYVLTEALSQSTTKEKLQEWFPQVFEKPSLEVGKWYKVGKHALICYQGKNEKHYGFNLEGQWTNIFGNILLNKGKYTLAHHTEVYNALTKEALNRGFYEYGEQLIKPIDKSNESGEVTIRGDGFSLSSFNRLRLGHTTIFDYGEWAEVVETITKEEAEKQLGKKIV